MPNADKKKVIIAAASALFAEKGLTNVELAEIAQRAKVPLPEVLELYEIPGDILQEALKVGQRRMEELYREPVMGSMDSHLAVMFDGLMAAISPWGPESYFNLLYQATKDKVLKDAMVRSSRSMGFAVKSFLAQMVAMSIVEEIANVERVINNLVSSFIEGLATYLEGNSIENIKSKWVANAAQMLNESSSTHVEAHVD
ncbi:TetR family transcriptional regulator [Candidatus Methanomassiliicoccus intestinalis]|uniref:TetR family transcriptional regulator n=1 Tax=Candidatus Methanomassiliicoccus intestinalis TaxID=1406512 RepID=UPI0037DBF746